MRYNNGLIDCNGVAAMMRPLISGGCSFDNEPSIYEIGDRALRFFYASEKPGFFLYCEKEAH